MKSILLIAGFVAVSLTGNKLRAQQVDSIYFHLYTDSLKKGSFNYINVDAKMSDGRWLPLTAKELDFTASGGSFKDNSLVLAKDFSSDSVVVTAILKSNNAIKKKVTIYIKKMEDNEVLKTSDEIMKEMRKSKKGSR